MDGREMTPEDLEFCGPGYQTYSVHASRQMCEQFQPWIRKVIYLYLVVPRKATMLRTYQNPCYIHNIS